MPPARPTAAPPPRALLRAAAAAFGRVLRGAALPAAWSGLALLAAWSGLALLAAAGCGGSAPLRGADPASGISAVLVRARLLTPTGETSSGRLLLNLESESESYRLPFTPAATTLFAVEPGSYRLHPTRGAFGAPQSHLRVVINGRAYRAPFPRDILRRDAIVVRPSKVVAIGIVEARLEPVRGEARMRLWLTLDDSVAARRSLVEDMIDKMLDPNAPSALREDAVVWTRALDQALVLLQGARDQRPAFKPGRP